MSVAHSLLEQVSLEGAKEMQASQKPCGCSTRGHLPCPATQRRVEGLGMGKPPAVHAGPGQVVRARASFVASLSLGGHVLNLCDGIVSQGC